MGWGLERSQAAFPSLTPLHLDSLGTEMEHKGVLGWLKSVGGPGR